MVDRKNSQNSQVADNEADALMSLNNNEAKKMPEKLCSEIEMPKSPNWFLRRIHILSWIRNYDKNMAISDLIAGITLGLTIIPQSIAYAALAGLSSQYGLYSAFMGSFVYVFFGTIAQVSVGPTSLMAILTLQFTENKPVEFVIILAFLAGVVELLMGVLKLGFIVSFISSPVTMAFTTATSLIVIGAQLKNLLGVQNKSKQFSDIIEIIKSIQLGDAVLGLTCVVILLLLRKLSNLSLDTSIKKNRIIKKACWYISISRNALVAFFSSLLTYWWIAKSEDHTVPYHLSSKVESAIPSFNLPPFTIQNGYSTLNFVEICRELGSGIIVVPVVAVLANVAIAKVFAKGGSMDASQEMLTLGICNIAGSFFSAMPTCGAFTRSAVSDASGVRTPLAGIYSGVMVLLALNLFSPYFQYIPKSTLSAILIAAVIFMVDFNVVSDLYKKSKKDFISWVACFIISLAFGVQLGLLFGIVISMFFILMQLGTPEIQINLKSINGIAYMSVISSTDVFFSGMEHLRGKIKSACAACNFIYPVVLNCQRLTQFDYTSIQVINTIAKDLKENNQLLVLQYLDKDLNKLISQSDHILLSYNENLTCLQQNNILQNKIVIQ